MRIRALGIIIFTLFFFLILGLFYIQIIRGPYYQKLSTQNRIRLVNIESPRGRIFDRKGKLLVDNKISFDVAIIPQELKDRDSLLENLSGRLGIPADKLKRSLKDNFITPFQPVTIVSGISKEMMIRLEEERMELSGMVIETAPRRYYPYGAKGAHIFGYLGKINEAELERLKSYGYRRDDYVGRCGIEKSYDNYLRGSDGGMQIEVNNKGYQVGILGIREPRKGKDLYLTIDMDLQLFIEEIFENSRGAVCVIDPRDGEVLSLISSPSFDPNVFIKGDDSSGIRELLMRPDYPMLNRAIQCSYPPGSVFKVVTSSAALETGSISPKTELSCSGSYVLGDSVFKCWKKKGHGRQMIREAIKNSCNVFFYQVGRMVGPDEIADFALKYGFGHPSGIDLPDEAGGLVPNRKWKLLRKHEQWYEGETLNYAIGQGYLLVTPLQIAGMMAAVANGGYRIKPYLVKRIEDVDTQQTQKRSMGICEETLDIVREGLIKVVNDKHGTGRKAAVKGLVVAGKTGTAQTPTGKTHAWFAGYAPAADPKAALVVFLEYGGKGGLSASRTAGAIFAKLRELGYL